MNLESCPPISKMVSTDSMPSRRQTCMAPVLWAVISSLTMSAPTSSPISSRPEPVVPTPRMSKLRPQHGCDLRQALLHHFDGPALGAQIDFVQEVSSGIDSDQVGAHRADVDPEVGVDDLARVELAGVIHAIAQQHHVLHGERIGAGEAALGCRMLLQLMDALERALARLLCLKHGGAHGAQPGVQLGHQELGFLQLENLAQRVAHALVQRDSRR